MVWCWGFWVRFGPRGPGFSLQIDRAYVPLFSERYGDSHLRIVGPFVWKRMRPLRKVGS